MSNIDAYNKEMAQVEATFNEYLEILSRVDRPGIENLIEFLKSSDFSTAPASTHYHSNFKGGLCKHSLNVYNNLKKLNDLYDAHLDEESMIVVALLHDTRFHKHCHPKGNISHHPSYPLLPKHLHPHHNLLPISLFHTCFRYQN